MIAAGYAVVATDYAGLGTPGQHAYLNKIPQANDVIYSIPAARQAAALANWGDAPEVRDYLHDSQSADKPIAGTLLVVAGDDDQVVSIQSITASVRHACAIGLQIEFLRLPGVDHDALMEKSTPDLLAWARNRLDGKPWAGNCGAPGMP